MTANSLFIQNLLNS